MVKFIMLVGLPGSGKSTLAKHIAELENAEVFSSDAYRLKLFGDENWQQDNNRVFDTLYADLVNTLTKGVSVILDATNINCKSREKALRRVANVDCYKVAIVLPVPLDVCIRQDADRERTVGQAVIKKFVCRFEYPQRFEGFDEVMIWSIDEDSCRCFDSLDDRFTLINNMYSFDQKNHWHKYSLGSHCSRVAWQFCANGVLQEAGLFHDVGKMFTQVFDDSGEAHYLSHANWSAYYMLINRHISKFHSSSPEFSEMMFYINQHMHIRDIIKSDKAVARHKKLWGEERYLKLLDFMHVDNRASGTIRYTEEDDK